MSKKLYAFFVFPLIIAFFMISIFSICVGKQSKVSDFNSFAESYQQMIADDTLLDGYKEKTISYDSISNYDGKNMIEISEFSKAVGEDFEIVYEQTNEVNAISVGVTKNLCFLKNSCGEKYEIENALTKGNEVFLPVDDVAKVLDYEINYDDEEISVTKTFETKRLIVYANGKVNNFGACAVAENYENIHIFEYETEKQTSDAFKKIQALKNVTSVEADVVAKTQETVETYGLNDSFSYKTWGAEAIHVSDYSNFLLSKADENSLRTVYVAVLDTGIDTDHPWFTNRVMLSLGKNFSSAISSTRYAFEDANGHGTHVSGTIVDLTLKNVKIIPVKVLGNDGYGYLSSILNGLSYVKELKRTQGINICAVNMSLGITASVYSADFSSFGGEINNLYNLGVLSVVAAGNEGTNLKNTCPANVENAITVSAVGVSGDTYSRPYWSNYGTYVDICAPGVEILSAKVGGGTVSLNGTSMATPHVTACVALLDSDPTKTMTPSEIDSVLKTNAFDLGDEGRDDYFGYGLVDMQYAYTKLIESVEFSRGGGACYDSFYLTLSHINSNAVIYYTTDGSVPSNLNGTQYTHAIKVETSLKIRAIAYLFDGGEITSFSKVSEMSYYFADVDILENYVVENGVLIKYLGSLKQVIIPTEVNGEIITEIGSNAFVGCNVESVTLSNNVAKINSSAFKDCTTLKNIYAPNVVEVGDEAFCNCVNLLDLSGANFKELQRIGTMAFQNCVSLTEITLPKLDYVDYRAFFMNYNVGYVSALTKINFPAATIISEEAFVYCLKLTEVILPNLQTLCSDAFYNCNIKSVSLPEVKYLGNYAFYGNTNLTKVSIPKAEIISSYCFYGTNLREIEADYVEFVGKYAFVGNANLTKVSFKTLKEIGEAAFYGCESLSEFDGQNVLNIQNYAFYDCVALTEINLPKVVSIQNYAFYNCSLNKITLSESLCVVGDMAFVNAGSNCVFYIYAQTPIKDYLVKNEIPYYDLSNPTTLYLIKELDDEVFIMGYTSYGEEVVLPSYINGKKITKIMDNAFKDCKNLKVVNSVFVKEIGEQAFLGCESLSYVNLPNVTKIDDRAFENCLSLQTLNIENATYIGDDAFYNCPKLLYAQVCKNVEYIGQRAFAYLTKVDGVYEMVSTFVLYGYNAVAENYVTNVNNRKELGIVNSTISYEENYYVLTQNDFSIDDLYIKNVKVASIKKVENYLNKNIIIPQTAINSNGEVLTIVYVGDSAFDDCSFIERVVLPSTITKISSGAFKNCSRLKSINLENVLEIEASGFEGCDSLTTVNLLSAQVLYKMAFKDCPSLETINAPELEYVSESAFENCFSLKNVSMPNVTQLFSKAFKNCSSLEAISLNKAEYVGTITRIFGFLQMDGQVFYGCSSLKYVSLASVLVICENSFYATNLKEVVLGDTIGKCEYSQTCFNETVSCFKNMDVTIYGYAGTQAQNVANSAGVNFVALDVFGASVDDSLSCAQYSEARLYITSTGKDETYEWYETTGNNLQGTLIVGENKNYLNINTQTIGTKKYYARVTNFDGQTIKTNVATVNVKQSFCVTTKIIGQGIINPFEDSDVLSGESIEFNITPRIGYYVSNIKINDELISQNEIELIKNGGTYTLENINSNTEFCVEFSTFKYNVTIEQNEHGNAVAENTVVEWAANAKINFVCDSGYSVGKLYINGEQVYLSNDDLQNMCYTIEDVRTNINIVVEFANTFTIETSCSAGGQVTQSENTDYDGNVVVQITPNVGFAVDSVYIDGKKLAQEEVDAIKQSGKYVFSGVRTTHNISVYYATLTYKITTEVDGNGTISFDKQVDEISYGDSRIIFFNPEKGFGLKELFINGERVQVSGKTYVLKNISQDVVIEAIFAETAEFSALTETIILVAVAVLAVLVVCFVLLFKSFKKVV